MLLVEVGADRHCGIGIDGAVAFFDVLHDAIFVVDNVRALSWKGVNGCLVRGLRGLPGGGSLARLLEDRRGVRRWGRKA